MDAGPARGVSNLLRASPRSDFPVPPVQGRAIGRHQRVIGEDPAMASDGRDVRRIGIRAAGLFTVTLSRHPGRIRVSFRASRYRNPRLARVGGRRRSPACTCRAYIDRRSEAAFRVLSKPLPRRCVRRSPARATDRINDPSSRPGS